MIYLDPGLAILALIAAVVLGLAAGVLATLLWATRLTRRPGSGGDRA